MNERSLSKPSQRRSLNLVLQDVLREQREQFASNPSFRVESLFQSHPRLNANPDAMLDLIYQEVILRESHGESVSLEEYVERFPQFREALEVQFEVERALAKQGLFQSTVNELATIPPSAFSESDLLETSVPGYELLEEIGRGGMGVVYRARQLALNRIVALKMVLTGGHAAPDERLRFQKEAEAVARVQHPNIVQIFEVGEVRGCPFLSLEYVEGGPLSKRLTGTPWEDKRAAALIHKLAQAVHVTHQAEIIHRDLKPANILLQESGPVLTDSSPSQAKKGAVEVTVAHGPVIQTETAIPKITDFGLARSMQNDQQQTESGAFMGTPSYCAPEQASGQMSAIGPHTDVYALGAVLYELLTGRPPFRGATLLDTLAQVVSQEPVAPKLFNNTLDRDLETICLKCLNKRQSDRYPSAEALAEDLERYQKGEPILARPAGQVERWLKWIRRKPAAASLLGVSLFSLLAVVGIVVALLYQGELESKNSTLQQAFGEANQAKENAEEQKKAADTQRELVTKAKLDLEKQSQELQRERDRGKQNLYNADMNLAERAWQEHRVNRMLKLLDRQHPKHTGNDYRGFEWYYLRSLENQQDYRILGSMFAMTPDGKYLVVANRTNASVWDLQSMRVIRPLIQTTASIGCVAISNDGIRVALGSWDRTIQVWDTVKTKQLATFTTPRYLMSVDFSPDGKRVISAQQSATTRLWDIKTAKEIANYTDHRFNVSFVRFTADGKRLVSGASDRSLTIRSLDKNQRIQPAPDFPESIWDIAFHPDGKRIAVGSKDVPITFVDLETAKRLPSPGGGDYRGSYVSISPDGSYLAGGGEDGAIRVWSLKTGKLIRQLRGHSSSIQKLEFLPDSHRVISTAADYTVRIWDITKEQDHQTLTGHTQRVNALAYSPDGSILASGSWDGSIKLWGKNRLTLFGHTQGVSDVDFHPDGTQVVSCSSDRTVRTWDVKTGRQLLLMNGHQGTISEVAYSPDGSLIATVSDDKTGRLWDAKTGQIVHVLKGHTDFIYTVAFHPKGHMVATGSQDGGIRLWDVKTGKQIGFISEGNHGCLTFSPDGKFLAVAIGVVFRVHDMKTLKLIFQSDQHATLVTNVAFTPDGKRLITTHLDKVIRFWDFETFRETLTLRGHQSGVASIALSRDGTKLATGDDRDIKIWDVSMSYRMYGPPLFPKK